MSAQAGDEPVRSAVALRWSPDHGDAPRVTAKGRGDVADAILAAAREHGVPVREDRDLVELLAACDLLDEIPTELYAAVARILSYLHALNSDRLRPAETE
jgi:flagellar biosynthesis protein